MRWGRAQEPGNRPRVVVVGGGFGGLYCAKGLRRSPVDVTLIDRRNFHLFQPLLYQVATGALSAANIATPLRCILSRQQNTVVLLGEVVDFDLGGRAVVLADGDRVPFDTLVVATGSTHHYFGNCAEWEPIAPGLKTVEDATEIRRKLLSAFERAERATGEARRRLLTFVVVGGGPTGVEMAGSVRELAHHTLRRDFRYFDPADARVVVVESQPRVLAGFHAGLSQKAGEALARMGIEVLNGCRVTAVGPDHVIVTAKGDGATQRIDTETVIWAAGVKASPLLDRLADRLGPGFETDSSGHIAVAPDCTVPGHPDLFVVGDCAIFRGPDGKPLPGVAPVAMQQGRYVADVIDRRARGKAPPGEFRYRDKGSMATVGRSKAVVDLGWVRFGGRLAWLTWLFVHILYLARFENRVLVLVQWFWNYVSRNRAARLITGESTDPTPAARHDPRRAAGTLQAALLAPAADDSVRPRMRWFRQERFYQGDTMSDKQPTTGVPATVPGGYHGRGVPGEEGAVRRQMRVLRANEPGKRAGLGRPLSGGRGADAASAEKESAADRIGAAAGPSGSLFVITAHASDVLNTPVFDAGGDGEEAVAVFTTADAARRYIDRAGWDDADEVGVLRPADQQEWFESAHDDGIRWVVIDPDRDRHLAGEPQPVEALDGDLAALARSLSGDVRG